MHSLPLSLHQIHQAGTKTSNCGLLVATGSHALAIIVVKKKILIPPNIVISVSLLLSQIIFSLSAVYLKNIPQERKTAFETANRYHFLHTLALIAVPLCRRPNLVSIILYVTYCHYFGNYMQCHNVQYMRLKLVPNNFTLAYIWNSNVAEWRDDGIWHPHLLWLLLPLCSDRRTHHETCDSIRWHAPHICLALTCTLKSWLADW